MPALVENGYKIFTDVDGDPLENGYIKIGEAGLNPLSNPIQAFWDSGLSIPASNIRTKGGYPSSNGSPGRLYTPGNYSILVQDKKGKQVYSLLDSVDYFNAPAGKVLQQVDTIADLRNLNPNVKDYSVLVRGYITVGDVPNMPYYQWNESSTVADNGGSIIAVDGVSIGRWEWGDVTEFYIYNFGVFGIGNETTQILEAFTYALAEGRTLILDSEKTYLIDATLTEQYPTCISLTSAIKIEGNNSTFQMPTFASGEYSLIHMSGSNIIINNLKVRGDADTHDFSGSAGEHGHGFHFGACTDVILNDTKASYCIGDGYYVGHSKDDILIPSERIVVRNGWGDKNMRQGMAIVCVDDILVDTFTATDTQNSPSHVLTQWNGLDIEPNDYRQPLKKIVINNLKGGNNKYDLSIYLQNYTAGLSDPVDITVNGLNTSLSWNACDIFHAVGGANKNEGSIIINDVYTHDTMFNGIRVTNWNENSPMLTITNIIINNNNTENGTHPDSGAAVNIRTSGQGGGAVGIRNISIENLNVPSIIDSNTMLTPPCSVSNENTGGNAASQDDVRVSFGIILVPPYLRGSADFVFMESMTPVNFADIPPSFGDLTPVPWHVFLTSALQQYVIPNFSYGVAHRVSIVNSGKCSVALEDLSDNIQPATPYGLNSGVGFASGFGSSITLRKYFSNSAHITDIVGTWTPT
jgi:hypothetical protein